MPARHLFAIAALAFSSLAFAAAPPATAIGAGVAPPCDRACMTGLVDRYLVARGSKQADDAMAYIGTLSCSDQLDTHVMDFITRLWPRRYEIVDEEQSGWGD